MINWKSEALLEFISYPKTAICKNYVGTHRCKCRRGFNDIGMAYKGECQGKFK